MESKAIILIRVIGGLIAFLGLFKFYCTYSSYLIIHKQISASLLIPLFITVILLISGIGIALLKNWTRILLLVSLIVGFVLQVYGLIFVRDFSFNSVLYTIIFIALICVFINSKIKKKFK